MKSIVNSYIEREKNILSRPDGLHFTGVESSTPQIISQNLAPEEVPYKPKKNIDFLFMQAKEAYDNEVYKNTGVVGPSVKRLIGAADNGSKTASSISAALPVAFQDTSQPIAKRVTFSPLRFRIWSSDGSGSFSSSGAKEELKDKKIPVGTYLFTLKTPFALPDITEFDSALPFSVDGKHAVLEKVAYDKDSLELKFQVRIVQNFVLIGSIVIAALTAGGFFFGSAGDAIEKALVSVDRVLDTTIVGFVVVGGGLLIAKRMGYI